MNHPFIILNSFLVHVYFLVFCCFIEDLLNYVVDTSPELSAGYAPELRPVSAAENIARRGIWLVRVMTSSMWQGHALPNSQLV